MYNFGDSNSDTGGGFAAFGPVPTPKWDVICAAEYLQLPYLSANLDSIGANLGMIWQFNRFKARTDLNKIFSRSASQRRTCQGLGILQAISTFDIGQNDLSAGFKSMSYEQLRAFFPNIINQFTAGIQARNDIAVEFNKQLKQTVMELRTQLPQAALTYVDLYGARICGSASEMLWARVNDYNVWCGQMADINGTYVFGGSCANPSEYISWDGVHYTDAANHWIANHTLNGS
ncbi:GDSL esterase/lipase [Vitis vinifera]|uniref:GDSL esterase/lipase n=1 Tax=Vitis vinifera TaxID=29760 RepID=A0A438H2C8_VITVI|nr:GDSL esterase/lipase [Vitis vinifera]